MRSYFYAMLTNFRLNRSHDSINVSKQILNSEILGRIKIMQLFGLILSECNVT